MTSSNLTGFPNIYLISPTTKEPKAPEFKQDLWLHSKCAQQAVKWYLCNSFRLHPCAGTDLVFSETLDSNQKDWISLLWSWFKAYCATSDRRCKFLHQLLIGIVCFNTNDEPTNTIFSLWSTIGTKSATISELKEFDRASGNFHSGREERGTRSELVQYGLLNLIL